MRRSRKPLYWVTGIEGSNPSLSAYYILNTHHFMNIVLVHGFLGSGKLFFFIKKKLQEKGLKCFTPTLKPINAKYGIEDLAKKLKDEINFNLGYNSSLVLIGFSMGGIVCRYYLQELNGLDRVKQFFTISTPHHGSYLAYLLPLKGIKQIRPKSDLLNKLTLTESKLNELQIYSFRTPFDLMIIPSSSSIWNIAINKKYYSFLHSYMLFNPKITKDLSQLILKSC